MSHDRSAAALDHQLAQRLAHRVAAHVEGAWVREAATAYAAKHASPAGAQAGAA